MKRTEIFGETIQSLIQERKDTEQEIRILQKEIDRKRIENQSVTGDENPGISAEMTAERDRQIKDLSRMQKEKAVRLKEICSIVRTISSGD